LVAPSVGVERTIRRPAPTLEEPVMRSVFWFFLLFTLAGVVVYSAIGITHN
jgi:hypothetical protein